MKGIVYSEPMALASHEGIKTVTRRICSGVSDKAERLEYAPDLDAWQPVTSDGQLLREFGFVRSYQAPYKTGERLYIKEAYRVSKLHDHLKPSEFPDLTVAGKPLVHYLADGESGEDRQLRGRYRHARFMPQALSRNTAEVVSIRGERLNALTPDEAMREGFAPYIVARILEPVARLANPVGCYYVTYQDNSHKPTGQRCRECAEKYAAANPGGDVFGPVGVWESDCFPGCEECGRLLNMCYTDYAVESELDNWEQSPGKPGVDTIFTLWDMIGCNFPELSTTPTDYDGLVGRLAMVGFRYLWGKLHPSAIHDDPMVWRIEMKLVEGVSHD